MIRLFQIAIAVLIAGAVHSLYVARIEPALSSLHAAFAVQ